jgi:hypothetical protein
MLVSLKGSSVKPFVGRIVQTYCNFWALDSSLQVSYTPSQCDHEGLFCLDDIEVIHSTMCRQKTLIKFLVFSKSLVIQLSAAL